MISVLLDQAIAAHGGYVNVVVHVWYVVLNMISNAYLWNAAILVSKDVNILYPGLIWNNLNINIFLFNHLFYLPLDRNIHCEEEKESIHKEELESFEILGWLTQFPPIFTKYYIKML